MTSLPPPTGGSGDQMTALVVAPADPTQEQEPTRAQGQFRDIWTRYKRNRLALIGLVGVILLVLLAIFEPFITPYDPFEQNLLNTTAPPSADHLFGTDVLGRDMFSALIYGTRLAVIVGLGTMLMSLIVGVALGALAGFSRGLTDSVIMRFTDIFLAFPLLVGAIVVVRAFGSGVLPVVIALVIFSWPTSARLMRGQTLALRESEYVEAARSIGASNARIVTRHILPNAIAPVVVYAFTSVGVVIVAMASLSFLGVGVPADVPEWGRMISQAYSFIRVPDKQHLWIFPALAIVFTTLAFAFVADGLRDALDPKLRGGH
ncbi:ABC transporter permease [Pseudonocardia sp. CA-107938]|uniref:ABC transporter permease n=1 Tax=Pseudonocardia sp. CA-107938 TaxID=3240021 RepID=UPI003D92E4C5